MFNLNLNGSTRSVDVSILNSSIESETMMMDELENMDTDISSNPIGLAKKQYYHGSNVNLSSYASNSSFLSPNTSSSSKNIVHQLTTFVNDLVIDSLITNSTPSLLATNSSNSTFNDETTSSSQICINNSTCKYFFLYNKFFFLISYEHLIIPYSLIFFFKYR